MLEQLSVLERVQLKQLIDQELDSMYELASNLGQQMGLLFGKESRSQLRKLEAVAGAATRTSALKNHIKNQTGKDRGLKEPKQTWSKTVNGVSLGEQVLACVEKLGGRASAVAAKSKLKGSDEDINELARFIELELQRGVVQTSVCTALYASVGKTS